LLNGDADGSATKAVGNLSVTLDGTCIDDLDGDSSTVSANNVTIVAYSAISSANGPFKHLEGANYSFAAGHVKWLCTEKVTAESVDQGHPSFLSR
jgi:hypothetical protein